MAIQVGAHYLEKEQGGRACCSAASPASHPPTSSSSAAASSASTPRAWPSGWGRTSPCIDSQLERLYALDQQFGAEVNTIYSTRRGDRALRAAGRSRRSARCWCRAPPRRSWSPRMSSERCGPARSSSTSRSTRAAASRPRSRRRTTTRPTWSDGVVHYCVANMPGAVARTSTFALNNATLPFVLALADKGIVEALRSDPHLLAGLNVYQGKITYRAVAEALRARLRRSACRAERITFSQAAHQFAERLPDVDPNPHCSQQKYGRRVEFRARYRGFQPGRPAEPHSFEHSEAPNRTRSKNFSHAASMGHERF